MLHEQVEHIAQDNERLRAELARLNELQAVIARNHDNDKLRAERGELRAGGGETVDDGLQDRRLRWATWPSPSPFEVEVHAPQLLELGLQAEGFLLAGLELQCEVGGLFLAPLELHLEAGGFLLASEKVAERGPPGAGVRLPAALREVGQQPREGGVGGAIVPEAAGRIGLEASETVECRSGRRVNGVLANHPLVQRASRMFPAGSGQRIGARHQPFSLRRPAQRGHPARATASGQQQEGEGREPASRTGERTDGIDQDGYRATLARMIVILSGPPRSFANFTRRSHAAEILTSADTTPAISPLETAFDRPSEQSTRTSSRCTR